MRSDRGPARRGPGGRRLLATRPRPAAQRPSRRGRSSASRSSDEVTDYEEFIGQTDAVYTVEVRARVTGYLDKVNFKDGDEVEKGALLFEIDPRPYKAEFDRTEADARAGRGPAEAARRRLPPGRRTCWPATRSAGRSTTGSAATTPRPRRPIGIAKAALDLAKLNLDFTKVTAPISGRLSRRMVDPGNLVKADDTLLTTIVSLDPMYVYFDIDERTLLKIRRLIAEGKIKSRQEAEIPVLGRPVRRGRTSRTRGRSTSATTGSTPAPAPSGSGP